MENKFEFKTGIDDVAACKKPGCMFRRTEESEYCPRHGFNSKADSNDTRIIRNLRINSIWANRLEELCLSPHAKSLLEEISLMRVIIENIVNACSDPYDLAMRSSQLSELLARLKDQQLAYSKIERDLNKHLDRESVERLCQTIVDIIASHVGDPDVRSAIAESIDAALQRTFSESKNNESMTKAEE